MEEIINKNDQRQVDEEDEWDQIFVEALQNKILQRRMEIKEGSQPIQ